MCGAILVGEVSTLLTLSLYIFNLSHSQDVQERLEQFGKRLSAAGTISQQDLDNLMKEEKIRIAMEKMANAQLQEVRALRGEIQIARLFSHITSPPLRWLFRFLRPMVRRSRSRPRCRRRRLRLSASWW